MNPKGLRGVANATQIQLRGHGCESGVLGCDDGLLNADVVNGSLLVGSGVLYLPEANHTTTARPEVLGDIPNLDLVWLTIEVHIFAGVDAAINVVAKAVALLQPLGECEDLVGGTRLESRRAAIFLVGVVVHAGAADRRSLALVEEPVLGHREDATGANLNRDRSGSESPLVVWGKVVHHRVIGGLLNIQVQGGVNLEATAAK